MKSVYGFYEGQKLSSIFWGHGQCVVGKYGVTGIEITMENGQMNNVPWATVYMEDGTHLKYNLALVEGVQLKHKR